MPDPTNASAAKPRRVTAILLPFIPIGLALAIALIIHNQPQPPAEAPPPAEINPVGTVAPDFSLRDAHRAESDPPVTLSLMVDKGPVVIIFYRGYSCPRCMMHLQTIASQIEEYTKAGVQIIAISPDTPANTRDSIQSYGDLPFPLLSDRDEKIARAFGLMTPEGDILHGAFVVDQERHIQFALKSDHAYAEADSLLDVARKLVRPH